MLRFRAAAGLIAGWVGLAGALVACGGSSTSASRPASSPAKTESRSAAAPALTTPTLQSPPPPVRLSVTGRAALPAARTGGAAALFGSRIVFGGGLSSAGTSSDTVFALSPRGTISTAGRLPGPVHDAAEAQLGAQLLLFGGGRSEGSNRIVRVLPGPANVVGRLPQALSDLDAAVIGDVAYVIGGWNGTATNRSIYSVKAAGTGVGVTTAARLPLGVRYPAAGALAGHVIIAGGEMTSGNPSADAWSVDPASGVVTRLPPLPAPTDHAPGAVLNGRFYLLGGLRRGAFSDAILSWAPGERQWRPAGKLPTPISDASAVSLPNAVALLGGRGASGAVAAVTWLAPKTS